MAQQQYSKPTGPPDNDNAAAQQGGYANTPMGSTTGVLDCNTLMTHHQQMTNELDQLDAQANALVTQMKEATSDRAKLDATMGVVEKLVTQRKQIRDRMSMMEHETLQFVLANQGADINTSCPQMTEWLQKGMMDERHTEEGGPDDLELGNDRVMPYENDNGNKPNNQ